MTGYSLCKHITNSLKSRSAAIHTALTKYNTATDALPVPQSNLSWEEVVEYAFLADFDLLRDTRQDGLDHGQLQLLIWRWIPSSSFAVLQRRLSV